MPGLTPASATPDAEALIRPALAPLSRRRLARLLRLARRHPLAVFGVLIIIVFGAMAAFSPQLATHDPNAQSDAVFQRPNREHWFGTDKLGRDVYSRVVYGSRVSYGISFGVVALGASIGTVLGLIAGYHQRWPDYLLQRTGEFFQAFPGLVALLIIVAVLGPSIKTLFIAFTIFTFFTGGSRVIRGAVISLKQHQYVEAARTLGASDVRLMFIHILPNVMPLAIVLATTGLGSVILALSGLSFLGLGVPPPNADWGADLSGQARAYFSSAPWIAIFPGLAISLAVFAFNLVGDALRDILDPRLRGS